jgi:hypothetical protein
VTFEEWERARDAHRDRTFRASQPLSPEWLESNQVAIARLVDTAARRDARMAKRAIAIRMDQRVPWAVALDEANVIRPVAEEFLKWLGESPI